MVSVTLTVDDKGLRRKIAAARREFGDRPLLKAIGLRHQSWIARNFDTDGKLAGGWKPLKPATIARRRNRSSRPLQNTGRLKQSFVTASAIKVTDNTVTVGTNVIYAGTHEFGFPDKNIPARPMLPTKVQAQAMAVQVIEAAANRVNKA